MYAKRRLPFLPKLLRELAPKVGASLVIEPEWGFAGSVIFKNGVHSYFRGNYIDLNTLGATEIAADKDYANFFMQKMGYPIVPGSKTFFSTEWAKTIRSKKTIDAAYAYAQRLGLPVIVKPNSGSQGSGVAKVYTKQAFYRAMRAIFKREKVALVQQALTGRDYRLVVLDRELISAYERIPLFVVGDGKRSVAALLKEKQRAFVRSGRDTQIRFNDPRIKEKLARQKLSLKSVPKKGEQIFLLDNANLSTGGESVDVTKRIHPEFRTLAIKLTRDMGLRLCGVDLMIAGNIEEKPSKYWILEINAAPGLDHYVTTGRAQENIVKDLYLRVLKALAQKR